MINKIPVLKQNLQRTGPNGMRLRQVPNFSTTGIIAA